ncbi:MAG: DNA methylase [Ruminococcus sp.]|nr:DNA methylase [Ruminococcus sp.]
MSLTRTYVAIDLKSFYASVECADRGLDPLDTNLVVADESRTDKTICLAVSPSLKAYGISGRARLFEVIQRVEEVNDERRLRSPGGRLRGSSCFGSALARHPAMKLDYIVAPPRMALYMKVSAKIYSIYLRYVSPEDIFAYSIDEVFIDATDYLNAYGGCARTFAMTLVRDVLRETGITATAGIGTNLYLAKVAMDIVAKHIPADKDGVRIAELDEHSYRQKLWAHTPITDFWRVGAGISGRLERMGLRTMGDIARASTDGYQLGMLYKSMGKNAELLIDHAWGFEPTGLKDVKAYRPSTNSLSTGQVLTRPTEFETARLILWEMAEKLSLDLAEKGIVTDQLVLTVGYDRASLIRGECSRETVRDWYGREIPRHSHGTVHLDRRSCSARKICDAAMELFDRIVDYSLLVRRMYLVACSVIREKDIPECEKCVQLDFFSLNSGEELIEEERREQREQALQLAVLKLRRRYGKNAVLKGKNFLEGGTAIERNAQIGGHRA